MDKVILLANLGSPDSTHVKDVKRYLLEFLMDKRVIDVPYIWRSMLVMGIIVPFRARKSALKYQTIWTEEGSPLIVITNHLAEKLQNRTDLPVYVCMRYANPSPADVFQRIAKEHPDVEEVILVPLYPHYAMSSYETAVEHVRKAWQKRTFKFQLNVVNPFYNHPDYIKALADTIAPYINKGYDHVLFSYHGIPERHLHKTDPTHSHCLKVNDCCSQSSPVHNTCYRHQVLETTRLVTDALQLDKGHFSVSFQSRLGTDKWLTPATADELKELPSRGITKLLVVSPAFVCDCLETLEELNVEGREIFIEAGGENYDVVACLNDQDEWVQALENIIDNY